jgi:hypothetical protein
MFRYPALFLAIAALAAPARAWNAHGHRLITYLALKGLPPEAPDWLRDSAVRLRIADQSNEPDRWRGWSSPTLGHENKPDHYIDLELLEQFGLTPETVPHLRYEYLRALAVAKHVHPEKVAPYDASKDPDRSKEWPGFLLHSIAEHYAKLQSAFNQVRIIEKLNDTSRSAQLEQARSNAIYHMGMLSHFVGDAAQPLHTTRHFNGWVGDNPKGYTTSDKFHSYIDGGVLEHHKISYQTVLPVTTFEVQINRVDPWNDVLTYVRRSFANVETLYQLEKSGELRGDAGRDLIQARLADAGAMLSAIYWAAWTSATPTEKQLADYVFFGDLKSEVPPVE